MLHVGWFPLAPREVYQPSYPVSRTYFDSINRSNAVIAPTTITNVYNTTIVNNTTNVTQVTNVIYANQQVPGAVVARASAFLCIGYGFNDDHLQPLMMERCTRPEVPLVLITKEISLTAHRFLKSGRCSRYVALEEVPKWHAHVQPRSAGWPGTAR